MGSLVRLLPRNSSFFKALLPSFVADAIYPDQKTTWRLHPTSYLDGLRGIASFIVFFCHYTENNFSILVRSYGIHPGEPSGMISLPYFRIIFSGRPMVHIFFVISGFVLSYKPIKCIHARSLEKCYTTLASSTFRRAFRLFGPCVASTFMIMCLNHMGFLGTQKEWSWIEQFWDWKRVVFHQITWPWAWDKDLGPGYDIHLWTIPIEFAHSMLLFMVILMLSRVKLRIRQAMTFGLMIYCLTCGKWAGFEFLAGMFLAEIHVLQSAASKDWESSEPVSVARSLAKPLLQILLILIGLFIGGWPNKDADKTPGIRWFLEQTPAPFNNMGHLAPQKFWFGLSAVGIVWAVGDLRPLKRLFEGRVAQYCGRVSYAVYICHGPVLNMYEKRVLGHPFVAAKGEVGSPDYKAAVLGTGVKGLFGVATRAQATMSWFVGLLVLGPLVVWAADIFWRAIDTPVVEIGKKIETACLDDEGEPSHQGYAAVA